MAATNRTPTTQFITRSTVLSRSGGFGVSNQVGKGWLREPVIASRDSGRYGGLPGVSALASKGGNTGGPVKLLPAARGELAVVNGQLADPAAADLRSRQGFAWHCGTLALWSAERLGGPNLPNVYWSATGGTLALKK